LVYALLGVVYFIGVLRPVSEWYIMLTLYLGFKWIFNYRKCTLSYFECLFRGVPRKQGYLNRFLDELVDLREERWIYAVYMVQFATLFSSRRNLLAGLDRNF
jgi:hypothetical protein